MPTKLTILTAICLMAAILSISIAALFRFTDPYRLSPSDIFNRWLSHPSLIIGMSSDGHTFGSITDDTTVDDGRDDERSDAEWQAGIRVKVVSLNWRSYMPSEGVADQGYVDRKRAEFAALRQKGFKLILNLGIHDTPGWLHANYPNTRYLNQNGVAFNLEAQMDQGDANAVYNPKVRELMAIYIGRVFSDFGTEFWAVRIGGGRYGELTYPPASYSGQTNSYWAFDANARAQSPTPGWLPGQPSPNGEASRFLDWYHESLTQYELWQVSTLRQYYSGQLMLLFPSWGIRPNQVDAAVAVNLNGSTSAEMNGEIQRGFDFARQVAAINDPLVIVTTTWLDADSSQDEGSDPSFWSPIKYLASLANSHPLHLKLYGENTGDGSLADMQLSVSQMKKYGLIGLAWYKESQLFSGSFATITDYQNTINQNK